MVDKNILEKYKMRWIIMVGSLLVFSIMAYLISTRDVITFDTVIREWFYSLRGSGVNEIVIAITHMGNWRAVVAVVALLVILKNTRMKIGLPLAISSTVTLGIYKALKLTFQRARPDEIFRLIPESGFSFPSGHSLNVLFTYGMLIFLINRHVEDKKTKKIATSVLTILIICIGLSRIFVGVHYPTDVVGGWSMAMALLMLFSIIYDEVIKRRM